MPGGDYRDALRERAGWVPEAGPLARRATASGWGSTAARPGYTVGQRQGLGVALGEPRYVSRIDPLTNTIKLGRREDLETTTIELERASFVAGDAPAGRDAVPRRDPDPPPRDADRGDRPAGDGVRAGTRRPLDGRDGHARSGPRRRARPPSSTTARSCSVAGGSRGRRRWPACGADRRDVDAAGELVRSGA